MEENWVIVRIKKPHDNMENDFKVDCFEMGLSFYLKEDAIDYFKNHYNSGDYIIIHALV